MPKRLDTPFKHRATQAERADRHVLYQNSVQAPEFEIEFFEDRYREIHGKRPMIMREDFCGTALLCIKWCESHAKRQAVGVDLCGDTLRWGRQHNLRPAGPSIASRISLINANVLEVREPLADVTCAMNFSYCIFKTRQELKRYFTAAREGLKKGGIFVLDLLGGTETMSEMEEEREIEGKEFTYIWDQAKFNPINHDFVCHIHFRFPDGSKIRRAFTYHWRLWTLPEIQEILREAGFKRVSVYWEEFEPDKDDDEYLVATGIYSKTKTVDNQESWVAYIVAES